MHEVDMTRALLLSLQSWRQGRASQPLRVQRVHVFRSLMFLDLTGNLLERITGLEAAETLRVLILAGNNLRKIENLTGALGLGMV